MELRQKADQIFSMAEKCESMGEYEVALRNYREVINKNPDSKTAKSGADRMLKMLAKRIYYKTDVNFHLMEGRLELHWEELQFLPNKGITDIYKFEMMDEVNASQGKLKFKYDGKKVEISCQHAKKWTEIIKRAKEGIYPRQVNKKYSALEMYINSHYTWEKKEEAVKYFMEMTGTEDGYAHEIVQEILGYGYRI